jgi:hypothetical protein
MLIIVRQEVVDPVPRAGIQARLTELYRAQPAMLEAAARMRDAEEADC